jgi:hypothetical protein
MFRKSLIAIAAAATLAFGMGGATAPAEAGVRIYIGTPGFYYGGYGHRRYHGYGHRHCKWVRVWHHGHWRNVRKCWRHSHY